MSRRPGIATDGGTWTRRQLPSYIPHTHTQGARTMTQMTERPDANQLLLTGGKAPEAADFGPTPPATVSGRLLSGPTTYHAREFDKANPGQGPLRYWPDG